MRPKNGTSMSSADASPPPFLKTSICWPQCGQSIPLIFSTMPMIGIWLSFANETDFRESNSATSCGVDDDGPAHVPDQINRRHRLIAGPRREIHEQEIQILPLDSAEQLVDEFVLVGIAPDEGVIGILEEEGHRRNLEVIGSIRDDPSGRADLQFLALGSDHLRDIGAMDI